MVYDINRYGWNDADWMEQRKHRDQYNSPMSTYEVHLGSWQRNPEEGNRFLSYIELGDRLIPYVKELGFTHIELLPVMEHPFDGSWGYQVVNFYAPTSRHGNPDEFRNFVDRCHQAGIGVILDWVPGHFPKDAHGLARYDGTCLYEHEDPRLGEHMDWGTLIFNYGRNEVKNFLIGNALFWLDEYHVDGLRVDAVASMLYLDYSRKPGEWVPNMFGGRENLDAIAFMKRCNEVCYERFPGIATIAEESTSWPGVSKPTYTGGLGFGFKWNMGWMNDSLRYISQGPDLSPLPPRHDHVLDGLCLSRAFRSRAQPRRGGAWKGLAHRKNARRCVAEVRQRADVPCVDVGASRQEAHLPGHRIRPMEGVEPQPEPGLASHAKSDARRTAPLGPASQLALCRTSPPTTSLTTATEGFEWIDFNDSDNSVWSFMRKGRNQTLVFVVNATPVVRGGYRVGVNAPGFYEEILNTDAETYGGSNVGNWGGRHAEHWGWQGRPYSILVDLPPLSVTAFKLKA